LIWQVKQFRVASQELKPGAAESWVKLLWKRLFEQYHDLTESMYVDEKSHIEAELGEVAKEFKEHKGIA
jgi:hypothetical protein